MNSLEKLMEIGDKFGCREELKNWSKENILVFSNYATRPTAKAIMYEEQEYERIKQYTQDTSAYKMAKELLNKGVFETKTLKKTELEEDIVTRIYVLSGLPPKDVAAELGMG